MNEPTTKPVWLRAMGLGALALFLSAFAWWPMLAAYPSTQNGDGQYFHRIVEAARVSVVRFHEWPLWNPFECGGVPLWDNPQSIIASPLVWLAIPLGVTRAMEAWYVLHSAFGFVCMWLFARHDLKLSRAATFAAAAIWAFSGFHQHHDSGGHAAFVSFLYLPLSLLLWRRAAEDLRCALGLGLLLATMIYEGAVYPLPHLAVLLAAETLMRAWPKGRLLKIIRAGAVVGLVAVSVGAMRFLPVIDQLRTHARSMGPETDFLSWKTFKLIFLDRDHPRFVEGQSYVWTEYATYVGPLCLLLAFVGIVTCGFEYLWMLALLLLMGTLMFGHFAHYAPWAILKRHVFPFKEMRVPSRFRVEVSLFLSAFAGVGVDRLSLAAKSWLKPGWSDAARTAFLAVGLLAAGDVMSVGISTFPQFFTSPPETPVRASTRLYFGGPDLAPFLDEPRQNRGRLQCWDEWGFGAGAPLGEGDLPQARATEKGAHVEVANRTANTFTLDVNVEKPSRILINSTYDRGWRSSAGTLVEQNHQLALDLQKTGRYRVHLVYWPRTLPLGIALTALGIAGIAGYAVRRRRTRKERGRGAIDRCSNPCSTEFSANRPARCRR